MGESVTWHDRRWQRALQSAGLAHYGDFIGHMTDHLVWQRLSSRTYRLTAVDPENDEPIAFYLKQYTYPDRRWRFLLRRDKPSIESRNYEFLRRRVGRCVPDVVATGQRRRWMMLHDAFILTVELPRTAQLDEYARTHWAGTLDAEERTRQESLLRSTAELVRRMHTVNFFHIDLQWRNVLIRLGETPGRVEAFFIDCPRGGHRHLWLTRRHGRLRDLSNLDKLARAYLTRTQRLRWFTMYTGRPLSAADRRFIHAVLVDRNRYERAKMRLPALDG